MLTQNHSRVLSRPLGPILLDELERFEQARRDVDAYEPEEGMQDSLVSENQRCSLESARNSYEATVAFLLLRRWQHARDEALASEVS